MSNEVRAMAEIRLGKGQDVSARGGVVNYHRKIIFAL